MPKFNSFRAQIVTKGKLSPVECPVCKFVLRDADDVLSVKNEKACSECTLNFKYINLVRWQSGWRPSIEEARSKMHI